MQAGADTSDFAKKHDLVSLKSEIHKFHIDQLETVPTNLVKLYNVVDNDVAKKNVYDELIIKVNAIHAIDTSKLLTKIDYDSKIKDIKGKIPTHELLTL